MKIRNLDSHRGIAVIDGLLSPQECAARIAWTESQGYRPAPVTTGRGPRMAPEVRNNTRVMADDVALARGLWERLLGVFEVRAGWQPVGLNERFRYYRYDRGERFNWHLDGAYVRGPFERSMLTLMVYLNEDFSGGQTAFSEGHRSEVLSVKPQTGMALVFPHRLLHTGVEVTAGRKYVMRTDVMYAT